MAEANISDILEKLLERRSILAREMAALDNLIGLYHRLSSREISESASDASQLDLYRHPSSRAAQAAEINRTIDAAKRLIIKEGRPMKRSELVQALESQGYGFPGADKNKVFGTNLWRSGKFRTIEGRGYWPKDVALPRES
jgi:hypothetical protein